MPGGAKRKWIVVAAIAAIGLAVFFFIYGSSSSLSQRLPDGSVVTFKRIERSKSYIFPLLTSKWKLLAYDHLPENSPAN